MVVGTYAPVDCTTEDVREDFYEHLTATILELKSQGIDCIVVGGDFNAQVAGHGHTRDNSNGKLLKEMCRNTGLYITL